MSLLPLKTYSVCEVWSTLTKNRARPKHSVKTSGGGKHFLEAILLHDLKAMENSCKNETDVRRVQSLIDLPHMHVSKDGCFLIEHCKQLVPSGEFEKLDFPEAEQEKSLQILIEKLPKAYDGIELRMGK